VRSIRLRARTGRLAKSIQSNRGVVDHSGRARWPRCGLAGAGVALRIHAPATVLRDVLLANVVVKWGEMGTRGRMSGDWRLVRRISRWCYNEDLRRIVRTWSSHRMPKLDVSGLFGFVRHHCAFYLYACLGRCLRCPIVETRLTC
jgi:hypothetical protein